ncbi:hypothetical protein BJX68DRAFT_244631 [Aspergillus pseudodeflectus]|uniref:Uncharacterized protein n=1 Tax=Aspergillus pseudodeflectus TaxID=176178 RepID=A0ABR4JUL6_9EURO
MEARLLSRSLDLLPRSRGLRLFKRRPSRGRLWWRLCLLLRLLRRRLLAPARLRSSPGQKSQPFLRLHYQAKP